MAFEVGEFYLQYGESIEIAITFAGGVDHGALILSGDPFTPRGQLVTSGQSKLREDSSAIVYLCTIFNYGPLPGEGYPGPGTLFSLQGGGLV